MVRGIPLEFVLQAALTIWAAFCVLPSPQHCAFSSGEAIVSNERGLAVFDLIRRKRHGEDAVLIVFDLIKLEGEDLRRMPEQRKRGVIDLAKGGHFPE